MIGEWVALPVLRSAGATVFDAVLRLPGESAGADQDVAIAEQHGLPVYDQLEDVPAREAGTVA